MLLLALFLLAAMDAIAKHLTETLAVPQILAIRFWVFLLFALVLAQRAGFARTVRSVRPGLQVIRSLVMVAQMTAFIVAVSHMPLADVHAVVAVAPLLVMVLAAIFLGEPIGPRRCAAVGFGFHSGPAFVFSFMCRRSHCAPRKQGLNLFGNAALRASQTHGRPAEAGCLS